MLCTPWPTHCIACIWTCVLATWVSARRWTLWKDGCSSNTSAQSTSMVSFRLSICFFFLSYAIWRWCMRDLCRHNSCFSAAAAAAAALHHFRWFEKKRIWKRKQERREVRLKPWDVPANVPSYRGQHISSKHVPSLGRPPRSSLYTARPLFILIFHVKKTSQFGKREKTCFMKASYLLLSSCWMTLACMEYFLNGRLQGPERNIQSR